MAAVLADLRFGSVFHVYDGVVLCFGWPRPQVSSAYRQMMSIRLLRYRLFISVETSAMPALITMAMTDGCSMLYKHMTSWLVLSNVVFQEVRRLPLTF